MAIPQERGTLSDCNGAGYLTILNALDALVYVTDIETHQVIFINKFGRDRWGDPEGKSCWEVLQAERTQICQFCKNTRQVDEAGNQAGVVVWEFRNALDGRWYQCRDQTIRWINGGRVKLGIASDITERKLAEDATKEATARAERLARIDELTGVKNRRAVFEEGHKIFNLAKRFDHPVSVIMLDLDYFKQVNDRYGHWGGDMALSELAATVIKNIREVDVFGRIGGEEFALILPETDLANGFEVAAKLQSHISAIIIHAGAHRFGISCSFGIGTHKGDKSSFQELLAEADKALYRAKQGGRNRIEYFPDPTIPSPSAPSLRY